jgi:hypothetical protein
MGTCQGHARSPAQPSLPLIESETSELSVSFSAPRIVAICDIVPPSESDFAPAPLTPPPVADTASRPFVSVSVIVKVSTRRRAALRGRKPGDRTAGMVDWRRRFLRPRRPAARAHSHPRDGLPAESIIVCAEANEQDPLPRRAELPNRVGRRIGADFGVGQRKSPWLMGQGLFMNAGCGGRI